MSNEDVQPESAETWFSPAARLTVAAIATICICVAIAADIVFRHLHVHASTWPQGWLNPFDAAIVQYLNRFANRWLTLDRVFYAFEAHNLLKGGPIVLLGWIAFFERRGSAADTLERRRIIVATVPLAIFGVFFARLLAVVLPFRERPLRTVALHFQLPRILHPTVLYGWSGFPSDHAVLFVTLACGIFLASRPLGILALIHTFLVVMLLRAYLGIHWPTDLLAGAALGVALASLATIEAYRNWIWKFSMRCWQSFPGLTAAFAFLVSYEIIDLFGTPLDIAKSIWKHRI